MSESTFEHEWRVSPEPEDWNRLLKRATELASVQTRGSFDDLVLGFHGFESVARDGWVLRIRAQERCLLELKERIADGYWKETSTEVGSPSSLLYVLRKIGLTPHLLLRRHRTVIRDTHYELAFDDIVGLGRFVEVENKSDGHLQPALAAIVEELDLLQKLPPYGDLVRKRYNSEPSFRESYDKLIKEFRFS